MRSPDTRQAAFDVTEQLVIDDPGEGVCDE
jgi:hypothetical protein